MMSTVDFSLINPGALECDTDAYENQQHDRKRLREREREKKGFFFSAKKILFFSLN